MILEKYYYRNDWDINNARTRFNDCIITCMDKEYDNVLSVLELYNVVLLIQGSARVEHINNISTNNYDVDLNKLNEIIAKFFKHINNSSIVAYANECPIELKRDFWDLIVKYEVYEHIDNFPMVAEKCKLPLYRMLQYKKLVRHLDKELSDYMRQSSQTGEMIIKEFLEETKSREKIHIPKSFTQDDEKNAINQYLSQEHVNPNILRLVINAPRNVEHAPVDDKMKINARHRFENIWNDDEFTKISYQYLIGATFERNYTAASEFRVSKNKYEIVVDSDWIINNLDYPTLLNNFIYLFGFTDVYIRSQFVNNRNCIDALEDSMLTKGLSSYHYGGLFELKNELFTSVMIGYYNLLSDKGVFLESIIKWFFESYLSDEFHANGFIVNTPLHTDNLITKCKGMVSALDGAAKQFRMYVENGEIDRELYEISSEHMQYEKLPSFLHKKYVYCDDEEIINIEKCLFSDQSLLTFTENHELRYSSLMELIEKENVTIDNFNRFQRKMLDDLISKDVIRVFDGFLRPNREYCFLLKEWFYNDVICYSYLKNTVLIDRLIEDGKAYIVNSLLSREEYNYIDFIFTHKYGNGLDLRNRYIHDTCSVDEEKQKIDYMQILKIAVLVVIKINEEFCIREQKGDALIY